MDNQTSKLTFHKILAIKLSTENISVNAIHPGGVNTSLGSQNKAGIANPKINSKALLDHH